MQKDFWYSGAILGVLLVCQFGVAQNPDQLSTIQTPPDSIDKIDFLVDVEPILRRHCLECHGPEKSSSSLRVDVRTSLLTGGDYGDPAIVPGNAAESFLYQVISGASDDLTMPPEEKEPLTESEQKTIQTWINNGAGFSDQPDAITTAISSHWSLQPIKSVEPPSEFIANNNSAIDAFVAKDLQTKNLQRSPRADRRTLIRRLYLVMLGMQPQPGEVESFLNDESPDAWERLVDRVLASPHYGERWGRHWLDVVRFGETDGFETNRERPNAWRYRDWVIDAFNNDKPYNEFVRQQIAGDSLGEPIGTGFLVGGTVDIVKSPDVQLTRNQRQDELTDFVNTTGTTFLGLTIGCARCHNHKFDPISQKDFYAVEAIFSGVQHGETNLPLAKEKQREIENIDTQLASLRQKLEPYKEPPNNSNKQTTLLPSVNFRENEDRFTATNVRFLRFVIEKVNNDTEPCIDELEVFAGDRRVSLATNGTKVTSSGNYDGNPKHKLEHINDGLFGNDHSWISNTVGSGWVQLEFDSAYPVDRVVWGRDRDGIVQDRLAVNYHIDGSTGGDTWFELSKSEARLPFDSQSGKTIYYFPPEDTEQGRAARQTLSEIENIEKRRAALAAAPKAYAGVFGEPAPIHRLFRGDAMQELEVIPPDTVAVLGSLELPVDATDAQRRLAFANWTVDPQNPLTARVIVNRLWQYQFGTGIVDTSSDFGLNGTPPTHPELLDWLANDLIANNWSLKNLQRQILLSQTWQQSSQPNDRAHTIDADSRYLWRYPPRRLEAESIRDCVLMATGVLDLRLGGPGFSAFEVELENVRHYFPKKDYGPDDWRRMVYQTKIRQEQDSIFGSFDCPDGSQIAPRRSRSTTPLQALNLFNSRFMIQQAEMLSKRIKDNATEVNEQIAIAFEVTLVREPDEFELKAAAEFIEQESMEAFCRALLNSSEFLFVN